MATQRPPPNEEKNPIQLLVDWLNQRLERTIFMGLKFTLPRKFVSPLGFLGFLTFTTFALLGISGALLMLYYSPTVIFNTVTGGSTTPFDSVKNIDSVVGYASVYLGSRQPLPLQAPVQCTAEESSPFTRCRQMNGGRS